MTISSPSHMRTASIINDGQNGIGLPGPLDAHDPKKAFRMKNTQNTVNHDTKDCYGLKPSLDTKDSVRAVLYTLSFELCSTCSRIYH